METAQAIYDRVATHLIVQGSRAESTRFEVGGLRTTPMYRASNGHRCAAGFLIPDEAYRPDMEGKRVVFVITRAALTQEWARELLPFRNICDKLQMVHDVFPADRWAEQLAALANREGLEAVALEQAMRIKGVPAPTALELFEADEVWRRCVAPKLLGHSNETTYMPTKIGLDMLNELQEPFMVQGEAWGALLSVSALQGGKPFIHMISNPVSEKEWYAHNPFAAPDLPPYDLIFEKEAVSGAPLKQHELAALDS